MINHRQIHEGMTVVSADGRALGRVASIDADGFVLDNGVRLTAPDAGNVFGGEVFLRKRAADVLDAEAGVPGQPSI